MSGTFDKSSVNEKQNARRRERRQELKNEDEILSRDDKRNLRHFPGSHYWSKEKQISVLKENGFKKR